uniref:DUF7083 domain-containing protein n=1 Tax=Lutzomyia longipalpis TaxID=7200 RepID=A0A1B0CBS5_LUTLO
MTSSAETDMSLTNLPQFKGEKGKFGRWIYKMESSFSVHGICDDTKKKDFIIHYLNEESYNVFCDKIKPKGPKDVNYTEMVDVLTKCFDAVDTQVKRMY